MSGEWSNIPSRQGAAEGEPRQVGEASAVWWGSWDSDICMEPRRDFPCSIGGFLVCKCYNEIASQSK